MYRSLIIATIFSLFSLTALASVRAAFAMSGGQPFPPAAVGKTPFSQASPQGPVKDPLPPKGFVRAPVKKASRKRPAGPNKKRVVSQAGSLKGLVFHEVPNAHPAVKAKKPPVAAPAKIHTQTRSVPMQVASVHSVAKPTSQNNTSKAKPPVSKTVAQASVLQREIILLQLEEQVAKLKQSIATIQKGRVQRSVGGNNTIPEFEAATGQPSHGRTTPQVLAINGKPGHLQAVLLLPGGGTVTVSGSQNVVPGGVRILSVSDNGVRAIVKRKMMDLPFYQDVETTGSSVSSGPQRRVFSNTMVGH